MMPINGSGLKRAALLNDLSCFGKCSLTVSIPIISSYGIETVPLPTAVLSTHTGGFDHFVMRDMTEDMRRITAHWKEMNMQFDCIYTGFFCTTEQIAFARQFIRDFSGPDTIVLTDPVLGDNGSLYSCFSEEFAGEMRRLCEMADIITPNRTEARLLLGNAGTDEDISSEALLEGLRNRNVIITSVRRGDKIGYLARLGDEIMRIEKPMVHRQLHGTGDVFTSALCGEILSGSSLKTALLHAADFCDRSIQDTAKYQPAHWYGLCFEEELKKYRR